MCLCIGGLMLLKCPYFSKLSTNLMKFLEENRECFMTLVLAKILQYDIKITGNKKQNIQ